MSAKSLAATLTKHGFTILKIEEADDQCDASVELTETVSVQINSTGRGWGVVKIHPSEDDDPENKGWEFMPVSTKISDLLIDLKKALETP